MKKPTSPMLIKYFNNQEKLLSSASVEEKPIEQIFIADPNRKLWICRSKDTMSCVTNLTNNTTTKHNFFSQIWNFIKQTLHN